MATPSRSNATESNQTKKAPLLGASARDGFVVIAVGSQSTQYHVHKALLVCHSEYFTRALYGPWREAEENLVTLNEVELETFEFFVEWLYTQRVASEEDVAHILDAYPSDKHDDGPYITLLTKAVVFGDRFLVHEFRKAVHNHIVDFTTHLYARHQPTYFYASKYAFENLPEEHPLCTFFVDVHCRCLKSSTGNIRLLDTTWFKENLPRTFLVELVQKYCSLLGDEHVDLYEAAFLERCDFHEHINNLERQECQKFKGWD